MAPKRQRGNPASTSYDSVKFVSRDAQERYASLSKRKLIRERGIMVTQPIVSVIVEHRKWEIFCQQPESAVVPVVREFYANALEHDNYRVMVRGKPVPFDRTSINRYYHLENIENDDYTALLLNENKWNLIIEALAPPGTEWKLTGSAVASFSTKGVSRESKAWHYFVGAKLLPVTHFSDMFRDRAALVYAITQDFTIDVGKIIQEEILRCAQSTTTGLGFTSMITGLCKAAGVRWDATEEWIAPLPLLDNQVFFRIKDRSYRGGSSSRARLPPTSAAPSTSAAPPPTSATPQATSDDDWRTQMLAMLASTQRAVQRCDNNSRATRSLLEQWVQHQVEVEQAIAGNFAMLATQAGLDIAHTVPLPQWNPHDTYTVDDEEEDEEDADGEEEEGNRDDEADEASGEDDI